MYTVFFSARVTMDILDVILLLHDMINKEK